jgi:TetR/AcrR family transcriptional regulator, regulator of autoinduction and epiphytic fitness
MRRNPTRALPPVTKLDGRHARKARTREAIVNALLELLDEGHAEPTAAEIAERAQVAIRSIGQHFKSREELLLAVAGRHSARLPTPTPPAPGRTFEARLEHFVATRVRVLEASAAVRRAAQRDAGGSKAITKALAETARRRREELHASLGAELKKSPTWLVSTCETLSSGAGWDALRHEQKLSPAVAEQVIVQALKRLLAE